MTSKVWKNYISECETYQSFIEPNSPFQNRSETQIKMFKLMVIILMSKYLIPKRFWDYVGLYVCDIHNLTSSSLLDYKTPTFYSLDFTRSRSEPLNLDPSYSPRTLAVPYVRNIPNFFSSSK